jgi:PilZ domain
MHEVRQNERRRSRRVRMGQSLRVRPSDPKDPGFEEIGTTKNVSRDGVYFITQRANYYEGMRLFVTLPYHSPINPLNHEYIGQVARLDELGNGQHGVAVRLLSSADNKTMGGNAGF